MPASLGSNGMPAKQGLYDPRNERDACGMGFVAHAKGKRSHEIVQQGLSLLEHLTHRGAAGCDPCSGDGAGIQMQIPHGFLAPVCAEVGIDLPEEGEYGVGMTFFPADADDCAAFQAVVEQVVREEGRDFL